MYRILSTNVLCWGNEEHSIEKRIPLEIEMIKRLKPDSFGVQEAHIDWMKPLTAALPEYGWVGVGREDGKEDGEFEAVFYLKEKFTASDSGHFWISETPDVPSKSWDSACTRMATYVKLTDKVTGKSYVHINTHLDHIGRVARVNGARMIAEKAASFGGLPVVATGDFNVTPDSDCYATMISSNMGDARTLAPDSDSSFTFHWFDPDKYHDIIDYVFVDRATVAPVRFRVFNEKINGSFYSDHYAVYADIELK